MTMSITCPSCQAKYAIPEEQAGKKVRCKKCQTVFGAGEPVAELDEPGAAKADTPRPRVSAGRDDDEDESTRRRPQRRSAVARRRDRYADNDEDDARPRRSIVKKRDASSGFGIFLIVGGVIGSLIFVVIAGGIAFWLFTREEPKESAVAQQRGEQQFVVRQIPDQPEDDNDQNKDVAAKEVNVKEPDPLPPAPREPQFLSPEPKELASANQGIAKAELDPEVVGKVTKATVYLRVTMPDGNDEEGSGFFGIARNIILTNAHVIGMLQPDSERPKKIVAIGSKGTKDEKKYTVALIDVDRKNDLAMLRVAENDIPDPLNVKSAKGLRATQRVWVAGFPHGAQLGPEMTLSSSSVSSLRYDDGVLTRVQVNGGMQPGNSGGPVVDDFGNVVGVSVSMVYFTQLNFAVPGEAVHNFVNGRIVDLVLGHPVLREGKLRAQLTVHFLDPLKRIKAPAINVWTGAPRSTPRLATRTQPTASAGDSPHQRQDLVLTGTEARAEILLPSLDAGKVYWFQPQWQNHEGESQWTTACVLDVSPAVELRPAQLLLQHKTGAHELLLNTWISIKAMGSHGEGTWQMNQESRLLETTVSIDPQERASIRLGYKSFNRGNAYNNETPPDKELAKLRKDILHLAATYQVDKEGNPHGFELDMKHVPGSSHEHLCNIHGGVQQILEGAAVPLPNKQVEPGATWTSEREVPWLALGWLHGSTMEMTYTYLGSRRQNGREEAVIALKGEVKGDKERKAPIRGRIEGEATVDLATGQARLVEVVYRLNMSASQIMGEENKRIDTIRVRLRRLPETAVRS